MVYGIGSPTLDQYWINFEFWNSSWIVNEKPWKAIKNEKPGSKPITVVVFLRTFLASPGWLPGYRNYTTNRGPKGLEVQPIRTAWTEKSSSADVQFMLCLRRLRRFNEIHMRFIWDSYEIHMRVIYASYIYIYIHSEKEEHKISLEVDWITPENMTTMQHDATPCNKNQSRICWAKKWRRPRWPHRFLHDQARAVVSFRCGDSS